MSQTGHLRRDDVDGMCVIAPIATDCRVIATDQTGHKQKRSEYSDTGVRRAIRHRWRQLRQRVAILFAH
jgi:hypothetical protein